ncbi:MAG: PQQ-dependent sugar dehydrogenase [Nitrososphaeraceae archaeon]
MTAIAYNNNNNNYDESIINSVYARPKVADDGPTLKDPSLIVQQVFHGLRSPTAMAFLGPDDILVLEKGKGNVQRIINGEILSEPLLQVDVTSKDERGLLGIAVVSEYKEEQRREHIRDINKTTIQTNADSGFSSSTSSSSSSASLYPSSFPTYVFLFFTEAGSSKDDDPAGNRVYKYELIDNNTKLVNSTLLLDLPATPDDSHVGGVLQIGPDNNLYLTVGDQRPTAFDRTDDPDSQTKAQNYLDGLEPDGRAGILRITQDGEAVLTPNGQTIFGNKHPLDKYYAYGVKNSFGFDFDPVTGKMWNTENGPTFGDEINLVEPGFNSGWASIQGFWTLNDKHKKLEKVIDLSTTPNKNEFDEQDEDYNLVEFDGKGKYSHPEFVWDVAPTALSFFDSDKLGSQYKNDIFVGDAKYGNIYHFELNEDRTELQLEGPLKDKAGSIEEMEQQVVFGSGFGVITDIEVGPDGYLYVLTFDKENGTIYKIIPATNSWKK